MHTCLRTQKVQIGISSRYQSNMSTSERRMLLKRVVNRVSCIQNVKAEPQADSRHLWCECQLHASLAGQHGQANLFFSFNLVLSGPLCLLMFSLCI